MARARNIKPGLFKNEDLAECSIWARFIFPGLWTLADREGRLEDRPKRIKGELLPFDNEEVEPLLEELRVRGFIERYAVGDQRVIQVINFSKHQNPHHREVPSALPPRQSPGPDGVGMHVEPRAGTHSQGAQAQVQPQAGPGFRTEEATWQGGPAVLIPSSLIPSSLIPSSLIPDSKETCSAAPHERVVAVNPKALFDRFWKAYPRKVGKDAAAKAFEKRRPDTGMVDLMVAAVESLGQSEQWRKDGGRFVPHPATWLNEGRWMDEPAEAQEPALAGIFARGSR